jgi:hypothetical protein
MENIFQKVLQVSLEKNLFLQFKKLKILIQKNLQIVLQISSDQILLLCIKFKITFYKIEILNYFR